MIDRSKQLPEELSLKPVRLAVEDIKAGRCHLAIESATEVLRQEEEEHMQKLLAQQKAEAHATAMAEEHYKELLAEEQNAENAAPDEQQ